MFSWAKLSSVLRKFDSMLHLTFKATFHATIENYATFLLIYSYFAPKKDHSIKFTTKRWHGLQTISIKFTIKGGMDCKLSFNVAILRTSCPKATLFKAPFCLKTNMNSKMGSNWGMEPSQALLTSNVIV